MGSTQAHTPVTLPPNQAAMLKVVVFGQISVLLIDISTLMGYMKDESLEKHDSLTHDSLDHVLSSILFWTTPRYPSGGRRWCVDVQSPSEK